MKKNKLENRGWTFLIPIIGWAILGGLGWFAFTHLNEEILKISLGLLNFLSGHLLSAVTYFFNFLASISALFINTFIILNPFSNLTIAPSLWDFFKNIAYVSLVFLSLWAGFQFILNKEDEARRLLIGILIIAFLINFTYVLAKEFFNFFWHLTKAVLEIVGDVSSNSNSSNFGEILYLSLAFFVGDNAKTIGDKIIREVSASISTGNIGNANPDLVKEGITLGFRLFILTMAFIGSALMMIFAGISFGKFFIISFLVGVLPLVCIAYLLPNQKKWFDQWWQLFLTWNINILIIIVLILFGIYLFASTNSDTLINNIFITQLPTTNSVLFNFPELQNTTTTLGLIISLILRFFIIVVYYCLVIYLGLKMGGKFAESGYNFAKWSWVKTGSLIAEQSKGLMAGPLSRLGSRLYEVSNTLAKYGSAGALVAKRIREAAKTLQKPAKTRDREIAESMWEAIKDESPETIAKYINQLKGGELSEMAKLISRHKSADEIFKIFANSPAIQKDIKARKILCGDIFNCALDSLMNPQERERAMQGLGQALNFDKVTLRELGTFLINTFGEQIKDLLPQFMSILANNLRMKTNFFSHPDNLVYLAENGLRAILESNAPIIERTTTFRIFKDSIEEILDNLGIEGEDKTARLNDLLNLYKTGQITEERLRQEIEELKKTFRVSQESLEKINKTLNNLIQVFRNPFVQPSRRRPSIEESLQQFLKSQREEEERRREGGSAGE